VGFYGRDELIPVVTLFVGLFGLVFGSFLNVCISRLPRHQSVVRPASRCPHCGAAIRAIDNVPVLSWLWLHGRCRKCGGAIAWRYPLIELAMAALFLLSWLRFGWTLEGLGAAVLCFLLLGLAAMDAETMRLPDAFTLPGIVLGVLYAAVRPAESFGTRALHVGEAALWAAAGAALLLAIRGVYFFVRRREGMGLGDAKLLALIAAWLGPGRGVVALFLGVVSTALYGLIVQAVRPNFARSRFFRLPLGAFLSAAAIWAVFEGDGILKWYMRFFR
jgi:leader peptidase (prepilin peptidase)/N-methyltransferase